MRTRAPLAALVIVLLLGAACGDPATTARAGQRSGDPWGRDFLSTAVTEKGQDRPLVTGSRIRLSFTDDGRLVASAGCNTMGGQAEVRDGRLVVADLATTEMGCDPERHAQDEWLAGFLASNPRLDLSDDELTLTGDSAEIRLQDREVADPDRPLQRTRWVVDTVVDGDAASSVPEGADAHVVLGEDGTFGGSTGCNQMGGNAAVDEGAGTIDFSDVIATKIACGDDRMALERAVLSVLDGKVTYEIKADRLTLTHPDGQGLGLRAAG
ncbi:MAG: META domain-containing protein [Acidimicrobiia bacterium]